jgi:hypothetical protein
MRFSTFVFSIDPTTWALNYFMIYFLILFKQKFAKIFEFNSRSRARDFRYREALDSTAAVPAGFETIPVMVNRTSFL